MPESQTVEQCWAMVEGHRMRFLKAGSGPPVLLVHGLLGYSFSWRFNIPELARHFQVFAVDLLGVGESDRPAGLDCSLRTTAARLLKFMRQQSREPWAVVGSSHGGAVSIWLAAMAQEAGVPTSKLVLVSPANPWSAHGRLWSKVVSNRIVRSGVLIGQRFYVPVRRLTFGRMYGDRRLVTRETLDGYARHLRVPGTMEYVLDLMKTWNNEMNDLAEALPRVDVPTLLMWGSKDRVVVPESAAELLRRLKSVELVTMPGAGHLPYEELPPVFNRLVLAFLLKAV